MTNRDLEIIDGEAAGAWIRPELTGAARSVTHQVPDRYEAYVRILHPASLEGESVTWAQVAEELGRAVHPLAQWDANPSRQGKTPRSCSNISAAAAPGLATG